MRVFYREEMIAESGSYSPSAEKPKAVVNDWLEHALPIEICDYSAVSLEDLKLLIRLIMSRVCLAAVSPMDMATHQASWPSRHDGQSDHSSLQPAMHWYPVWPVRRPADFITRPMRPAEVSARSTA